MNGPLLCASCDALRVVRIFEGPPPVHICGACGQLYREEGTIVISLHALRTNCPHCGCDTGVMPESAADGTTHLRCECCGSLARIVVREERLAVELVRSACEEGCLHPIGRFIRSIEDGDLPQREPENLRRFPTVSRSSQSH